MSKNNKGYILLTTLCLIMIFTFVFTIYGFNTNSINRYYQQLINTNYQNYLELENIYQEQYGILTEDIINNNDYLVIDHNHIKNLNTNHIYLTYQINNNKKEYYLIRRCCIDE